MERLNAAGVMVFSDHSRLIRTAAHIVQYAADLRHRIARRDAKPADFAWHDFTAGEGRVVSEHLASRILEAAGLNVACGRIARTAAEAVAIAAEVGFPVAMKAISPAVTHRAAAGLVALDLSNGDGVAATFARLSARAGSLAVTLDGVWVQHMFQGRTELLVTAFRDADFGVMVGCGMGDAMTEIIDDVAFTRAPIDEAGAADLLIRLRTLRRLPDLVSPRQRDHAAAFVARFSALAASAPWPNFTFEVNPLKLEDDAAAAVDGLLLIE